MVLHAFCACFYRVLCLQPKSERGRHIVCTLGLKTCL